MNSHLPPLFRTLTAPGPNSGTGLTLNGVVFPVSADFHLGKDEQGRPVVVIRVPSPTAVGLPPVELENLRVDHLAHCRILQASGREIEDKFSVIRCLSYDHSLQEYFLNTMEEIATALAPRITAATISSAIHKLAELFQALTRPPSRPLQGLWAELFVIRSSRDQSRLLRAWHSEAEERFDFGLDDQRLETKCSSTRDRRHHFSLEQAQPSAGLHVLIASLFVEGQTNGLTLGRLWDEIRDFAGGETELAMKIERVCCSALGASWNKAREKAFDEKLARESLAFYDAADIPRVSRAQPMGVTDIRFCSDLSRVKPINIKEFENDGSLFAACPLVR
ncbi:MAG: PD-(D/E)XK motif protein [Verrucomicrobia bacterium]|nr:PD-(D/E)XK motif protein [Verrucomicrobiota bacterium]